MSLFFILWYALAAILLALRGISATTFGINLIVLGALAILFLG